MTKIYFMKKVRLYSVFTILLILLVSAKPPAPAKTSSLQVRGYVFKDDKKIDNAIVKLYQHNKIVQIAKTKKSKFDFILFSNLRYMVEVSYDGCVTERIQISTMEKTEFSGKYMYEFRVDLMDMKDFEGVDISDLDFPTALIKYNTDDGEYWHDEDYSKSVNKQLKALKTEAKKK